MRPGMRLSAVLLRAFLVVLPAAGARLEPGDDPPVPRPGGKDAPAKSGDDAKAPGKSGAKETPRPAKPAALLAQRRSRSTLLTREGGSKATDAAVRSAIDWLLRHQSPDGGWLAADFVKQCKTPCRNKSLGRDSSGKGLAQYDLGVTGLALLALAGAGHSHLDTEDKETSAAMQRAMGALLRAQESTGPAAGRIGGASEQWVYDHAIATLALTEILLLSGDDDTLRAPVTSAVKLCIKAQNPGRGWRYGIQPQDNDTSVTGWMVLALETASHARLEIPKKEFDAAFQGARAWFDRVTKDGRTGYFVAGDPGSRLAAFAEHYPFDPTRIQSMTALATLCRLVTGAKRKDPVLAASLKLLAKNPPLWKEAAGGQLSSINFYYWFHGSHAVFQQGGPAWKSWSKSLVETLVKNQRTGGDEQGSWDPVDDWGSVAGRVYSTALGALALEVFYRYPRARDGVGL